MSQVNLKEINIKDHCKLIINDHLWEQIRYLHSRPKLKGLEWSGVLLWNFKEGSVTDPENLVLEAQALYLMDVGTGTYTEYEHNGQDLEDMFKQYPQSDPFENDDEDTRWIMGHIHTHHNMEAYFSGTDLSELRENAPNNKYYLSLIVNYANKPVAKLCVTGKQEATQIITKSIFGDKVENVPEKTVIYYIDCDIEIPSVNFNVGDEFKSRVESLTPVKPVAPAYTGYKQHSGYGGTTIGGFQSKLFQGQQKREETWPKTKKEQAASMSSPYSPYKKNVSVSYDVKKFLCYYLTMGTPGYVNLSLADAAYKVARVADDKMDYYLNFLKDHFDSYANNFFPGILYTEKETLAMNCINELKAYHHIAGNEKIKAVQAVIQKHLNSYQLTT